jgi:ABC-type transport system involved in cytochrome bd biosynthesis fused ATPase/permease subunit
MFPATVDRAAVRIRVPRFVLRRGAKVGIIGPSGVGKSTVLTMLTNQLPTAGGLRLDGAPLPAGELGAGFITVISNSDPLFKLPLRENVLLGRDVSPTELSRILTGVRANEFYGDGAAVVGSPEFNLSAGQEQRIRLARGLLQASEVYLLDEPFNSVDQATKGEILRFLGDFLRERTVVLVTHNPDDLGWIEELYRFNGEVLEPYPRSVLVRS